METPEQPLVTVGIPAFNSEKNLSKSIESVLNQTFQNFILIISDNASTDLTSNICMEYAKKDNRIKYIRQEKNLFVWGNFRFLANSCNTKYFVWFASDDCWEPTFLEKNIEILESNQNLVGSITEIDFFGRYMNRFQTNGKIEKHSAVRPFLGKYSEKIKLLLKSPASMIYGVYRTEPLQKSIPKSLNWRHEYELLIPLLKHGDFYVIDNVLMHRNADGMSSSSEIHALRASAGIPITGIVFLRWPIIRASLKNLGLKFVLKNSYLYVRLMYTGYGRFMLDLLRSIKKN